MRAEGLVVSDSAVLDTVESLRRHRVGAGPLEPLLKEPGVTDVLVNGTDHVFIDRGARARADGRSISMRTRRAPACLASGSLCRPASRRDATADNGEGGQGRAPAMSRTSASQSGSPRSRPHDPEHDLPGTPNWTEVEQMSAGERARVRPECPSREASAGGIPKARPPMTGRCTLASIGSTPTKAQVKRKSWSLAICSDPTHPRTLIARPVRWRHELSPGGSWRPLGLALMGAPTRYWNPLDPQSIGRGFKPLPPHKNTPDQDV
jgi:hypothetical protein